MIKVILKSSLVLSIFAWNLSLYAGVDRTHVAYQCYLLSETVNQLTNDQKNPTCIDKLTQASSHMNTAAGLILERFNEDAKNDIIKAAHALQYAQLNGCNHHIEIAHSRLEAYKIKQLL